MGFLYTVVRCVERCTFRAVLWWRDPALLGWHQNSKVGGILLSAAVARLELLAKGRQAWGFLGELFLSASAMVNFVQYNAVRLKGCVFSRI